MARRDYNRRQIERFLVFFDVIFPAAVGFINVEEMTGKPESRPPIPERAFDFIDDQDNRETARLLNRILGEMRGEWETHPLYTMAGLVAGWIRPLQNEEIDHGAVRRWKAGETQQDRNRADLFKRTVKCMEERLNDKWPHIQIRINIPRRDEEADTPIQGGARDREESRRKGYALAHHIRYQGLLALQNRYPEATRASLKAMWSEEFDMSIPTIRDSIRFCECHEWPDGTPVEQHLRWGGVLEVA